MSDLEEIIETTDTEKTKGKKSQNQAVERWLNSVYEFRYNTIKQKPEWRLIVKKQSFKPIDKYKLLSIRRELDAAGYNVSKESLSDILSSSFSPAVNPIKEYFHNLFPYDEITDHIGELASTVTCKNTGHWNEYLKKWLVAVVANTFIDEICANHTMLVLAGSQGKFKTSWIENLCPKELKSYLFSGKLNLKKEGNKDVDMLIAECFIINVDDQLIQLNKDDENELKNIITKNQVKYRRPYDPYITDYPHLASFTGTVNGNEFLNDPTGSRRFLPFEVENINIKAAEKINMDLVWAQAQHLYKTGFRYWFNDEEIQVLNRCNEEFSMRSKEEELLSYYYSPTIPSDKPYAQLKAYTPTIILSKIEINSRVRLSQRKLGQALTKLGYQKKQLTENGTTAWKWLVHEKEISEIEEQSKQ